MLLAFAGLISISHLLGQRNVRFANIGMEEGLSNNQVRAIVKDRQGFIWIGTSNGLQRYDGYSFKTYQQTLSENSPLASSEVRCLLVGQEGSLWIGTRGGGLTRMKNGVFKTWRAEHTDGLASDYIEALAESPDGSLWIGTKDAGLCRFKEGSFKTYEQQAGGGNSLSHNSVFSLATDDKGQIWIGTFGGGLDCMDKEGNIRHIGEGQQWPASQITALLPDYKGNIWVGTWKEGLHRVNKDGSLSAYAISNQDLGNSSVLSLDQDRQGNLWIGTWGGGLLRYSPEGAITRFKNQPYNPQSLSNNEVESVFADDQGIIWAGTYIGGISRLMQGNFEIIEATAEPNGLKHEYIGGIYKEPNGKLWIGTYEGGLYSDQDGQITAYPAPTPEANSIWGIAPKSGGGLWLGTEAGLLAFEQGNYQSVSLPNSQDKNKTAVYNLTQDRKGRVWFGDWRGAVYCIEQGNIKQVLSAGELKGKSGIHPVFTVLHDSKGRTWVSRYDQGGLLLIDSEGNQTAFEAQLRSDALPSNNINRLIEDAEGRIWVGTTKGLSHYQEEDSSFRTYRETPKLAGRSISSIEPDGQGNLWVSTLKGLFFFNPQSQEALSYSLSDGLPGEVFIRGASFRDNTGRLYFGGQQGLVAFHPGELRKPQAPPLALTSLSILDQPIDALERFGRPLHQLESIELAYWENSFSVEFASLEYSGRNNTYLYYLEGLEDPPKDGTDRHFARYSGIPYGSYTLHIANARHPEKRLSIQVTVNAPFWDTWWFKVFTALLLFVLGLSYYKYRLSYLKKQQAELEQAVEARTEQVQSQNRELQSKSRELSEANMELSATSEELRQNTEELSATNSNLKQAQQELEEALQKEQDRYQELKQTQERLLQSEKMASIGLLTAGIAHEIKNPINFISAGSGALALQLKDIEKALKEYAKFESANPEELKGLQEALAAWKEDEGIDEELASDALSLADDICMGSDRVIEIVNSLRSFSRTDATEWQTADVHQNIDGSLVILNSKYKDRIEIERKYDPELPPISCYPGKLGQVFMNILANAIQAIPEKGLITIETLRTGENQVSVKISDTGTGMPESVKEEIFNPFFTTKGVGQGTGLGLHISVNIIEQHHGKISVESQEGQGTTFLIELPIQQDESTSS